MFTFGNCCGSFGCTSFLSVSFSLSLSSSLLLSVVVIAGVCCCCCSYFEVLYTTFMTLCRIVVSYFAANVSYSVMYLFQFHKPETETAALPLSLSLCLFLSLSVACLSAHLSELGHFLGSAFEHPLSDLPTKLCIRRKATPLSHASSAFLCASTILVFACSRRGANLQLAASCNCQKNALGTLDDVGRVGLE